MDMEYAETTGNILLSITPEEATTFALAFATCATSSIYIPPEALAVMQEFTAGLISNVVPHLSPGAQTFLSDMGIFFTEAARPDVTDIEPTDIRPTDEPE